MEESENLVLFIDDEEVNLLLFEASFSKMYSVFLAQSAKEAEMLIEKHQFKVVISDINMPNESGLAFLKRVKFKEVQPILILLSAYINNNFLLEALNQGNIYRYLTKPWNFEEVKFTIDKAIQTYDLHYNNYVLNKQKEESRQNFQNIFQSSLDGIIILNNKQDVLQVNKSFSDNIGNNNPVNVGCKLTDFLPIELYPTYWESVYNLESIEFTSSELEYHAENEIKKFFEIITSRIEYQGEQAAMSIFRNITDRRQNEQKILNAVILAEEKERSRLAKELHDGLGPVMATLKMYLEWLNDQDKVSDHPDILGLSLNTINEAIVSLKNISNNLSPHILEKFGLVSALTSFIEKMKKITSIQFNPILNITSRFSLTAEISLYRILTECINNTVRHADASIINLELWQENTLIYFSYNDNGKGFELANTELNSSGMGLYNIKNRIKTLGGTIFIQSEPGAGFKLEGQIPLN